MSSWKSFSEIKDADGRIRMPFKISRNDIITGRKAVTEFDGMNSNITLLYKTEASESQIDCFCQFKIIEIIVNDCNEAKRAKKHLFFQDIQRRTEKEKTII